MTTTDHNAGRVCGLYHGSEAYKMPMGLKLTGPRYSGDRSDFPVWNFMATPHLTRLGLGPLMHGEREEERLHNDSDVRRKYQSDNESLFDAIYAMIDSNRESGKSLATLIMTDFRDSDGNVTQDGHGLWVYIKARAIPQRPHTPVFDFFSAACEFRAGCGLRDMKTSALDA